MPFGQRLPGGPDSLATIALLGELLPDGLVVASGEGDIRFVNAEALRILDCSADELLGHRVTDVLALRDRYGRDWWARTGALHGHVDAPAAAATSANGTRPPGSEHRVPDPATGTLAEEQPVGEQPAEEHPAGEGAVSPLTGQEETLLVAPNGRDVLITASFVRDSHGVVTRVLLGLRDAEARLRAEADQATVLSTVAHELRAPLTSVTGFTSSLLRRWTRFTDEQKRLMIETIHSDATRLTRLITELLDISRLDTDTLSLRLGPVDVEELVSRHVVRHDLGVTRGAIRMELGPVATERGLPELWADADRLDQVFFNLIENALQHGAGLVTVVLDRDPLEPETVVIHVEDEGEGIPEEYLDKVFGRFWHGPGGATTGLGLYVARGLVEAHGGSIGVGRAQGGGARFTVCLPANMPGFVPDYAS